MITLVRVIQTAMACPSQWDAWDAEGNYYYLRYRYGHGQAKRYQTEDWAEEGHDYKEEFLGIAAEFTFGHPLDGCITLDEFCELAGIALAPDAMVTSFGHYLYDELVMEGILSPAPDED